MVLQTVVTGVLIDETASLSVAEMCAECHVSEDILREMMEHGLFNHDVTHFKTMLNQRALSRVQSAARLQEDLELNLAGAVLVLELLDKLEQLRNEVLILRHHVGD